MYYTAKTFGLPFLTVAMLQNLKKYKNIVTSQKHVYFRHFILLFLMFMYFRQKYNLLQFNS